MAGTNTTECYVRTPFVAGSYGLGAALFVIAEPPGTRKIGFFCAKYLDLPWWRRLWHNGLQLCSDDVGCFGRQGILDLLPEGL